MEDSGIYAVTHLAHARRQNVRTGILGILKKQTLGPAFLIDGVIIFEQANIMKER